MTAPEVHLIKEDEHEIYFAHRPLAGIFIMLIGMSIVYFFTFKVQEQAPRWLFGAFGTLFALAGLAGSLWRYELRLNIITRSYSGRKGFWLKEKQLRGSFDELEGVVLSSRIDRSGKNTKTVWVIGLLFRNWEKPVKIKESLNEPAARRTMEHYAKKLRIPIIDRTGAEEQAVSWEDVDRPLGEQPGRPVVIPPLPSESAIAYRPVPGRRSILLPAQGFSAAALMLFLFGLQFFSLSGFFLWALLFNRVTVQGSIVAGYIIAPLFMLAGLLILLGSVVAVWGRQLIEEEGGDVAFGLLLFSRRLRTKRTRKREVEEVSIRPVPGRKDQRQLVVRSDKLIMNINEQKLSQKEMEWLRVAVAVFVSE